MSETIKNPTGEYIDASLGRYEMVLGSHKKFWECLYDQQTHMFVIRWGRIGSKPRKMVVDQYKATEKIREKTHKGYKLVINSFKTYQEINKYELNNELKEITENKTKVSNFKKRKM